jgi:hypothetical protein
MNEEFYKTGIVNHKFILTIDPVSLNTIFDNAKWKEYPDLIKEAQTEFIINDFRPCDIIKDDKEGIVYYKEEKIDMKAAMAKADELIKKLNQYKDFTDEKGGNNA